MHRRQFLHTANAVGASLVLPVSAAHQQIPLGRPQALTPGGSAKTKVVEISGSGKYLPRFGIAAIGGQACAVVDEFVGRLPGLARAVVIDTDASSVLRVNADQYLLLDGAHPQRMNPHTARQLAQSAASGVARAVVGLDMVLLVTDADAAANSLMPSLVAKMLREQSIFTLRVITVTSSLESQFTGPLCSLTAGHTARTLDQLWQGVLNNVCRSGWICFDLEDLRSILDRGGECGFGSASGTNDGLTAARDAIHHPSLSQHRLQRASDLLITICTGRKNFLVREGVAVTRMIASQCNSPSIICGGFHDENLGDDITVSILAGGIHHVPFSSTVNEEPHPFNLSLRHQLPLAKVRKHATQNDAWPATMA